MEAVKIEVIHGSSRESVPGDSWLPAPVLGVPASRMCASQGALEVTDWEGWSVTQDYSTGKSRSLGIPEWQQDSG